MPISSRMICGAAGVLVGGPPTFIFTSFQPSATASRASRADLLLGVAEPAGRGRVGGEAVALHLRAALVLAGGALLEQLARRAGVDRVGEVLERDGLDELLGCEVGDEPPQRLALGARPHVPHRVDDRGGGEVDDALLRAEPAQLRVARDAAEDLAGVGADLVEVEALHARGERLDGGHAQLVAAAFGEREAVALEPVVGGERDVRRRVVGVGGHRVGAVEALRGGEADVAGVRAGDHGPAYARAGGPDTPGSATNRLPPSGWGEAAVVMYSRSPANQQAVTLSAGTASCASTTPSGP